LWEKQMKLSSERPKQFPSSIRFYKGTTIEQSEEKRGSRPFTNAIKTGIKSRLREQVIVTFS